MTFHVALAQRYSKPLYFMEDLKQSSPQFEIDIFITNCDEQSENSALLSIGSRTTQGEELTLI